MTARPDGTRWARGLLLAPLIVVLLGAVSAAAASPVGGQQLTGAPTAPDSTVRDVMPGRPVTVAFAIANTGRAAAERRIDVTLPDGWRILSGAGALRLAAGERRAHLVQVSVPSDAAAGLHAAILRDAPANGRGAATTDTAYIRVREARSLALEATRFPPLARAGAPFTVEFLLRNRGNRSETLAVRVEERRGFATKASWMSATLRAGDARTLVVTVTPPGDLPSQARHRVGVVVATESTGQGAPLIARAASDVIVLPQAGRLHTSRDALPATLRVISSSAPVRVGERASSATVELSGGGALRERGEARVDFLLRGPGANGTAFNDRDEYRVALRSPHVDVTAGDQSFSLSPLTGYPRDRTGMHAAGRIGGFLIGGLAYRDRRGFLDDAGYGASAGYARPGIGSLTVQAIERTGHDAGRVASVRGQVEAIRLAKVDAELAVSPGADSMAAAYRLQLSGSVPRRFSYALSQRQADLRFGGYAPGTLVRSGRADVRVVGAFGIRARAGEDRIMARPAVKAFRGEQHTRHFEADAYLGRAVSAGLRTMTRDMIGGADTITVLESSVRVAGELRAGPTLFRAAVDVGSIAAGTSVQQPTRRESLTASFAGSRNSASVFAEHRTGPRWYDRTPREELTVGLTTVMRPIGWLSLRGTLSTTQDLRSESGAQLHGDATIAVVPRRGHELSLRARTFASGMDPSLEPSLRLAYSLPIGVPIGRSDRGGRLVGRVYDAESGHGLANAVIVVGDRLALTDRDGRVQVDGIPEGTQYIQLDLGASGADRIPTVAMPLRISSRQGSTARIEVPVARTVSITGSVRRLAPQSMGAWDGSVQALTDSIPMEGMIVRIVRETDVHTVRTDAAGAFALGNLRPGRWTIRIAPTDLPAHHYLESPELTFEVAPGQQARGDMRVLPRKRAVMMVDRAAIVAEGATPIPAPAERLPAGKELEAAAPQRASAGAPTPAGVPPLAGRSLLFLGQSFYIVGETDRSLENIALLTYGEAAMWPKLWAANRHQLSDPDAIRAGMILTLPPRGPLTTAERAAAADVRRRNTDVAP